MLDGWQGIWVLEPAYERIERCSGETRYEARKRAPFLGPHSQKRLVRKESGKAMQGTDPVGGSIQRRSIRSEGQFVGGLFHYHAKKHLPHQMDGAGRQFAPSSQKIVRIGVRRGLHSSRGSYA